MGFSVTALGVPTNSVGNAEIQAGAVTPDKETRIVTEDQPADPAVTASAVPVMAGLGELITPLTTGRVRVVITGQISNDTGTDGADVLMSYDDVAVNPTPANGDAAIGNVAGNAASFISPVANDPGSFAIVAVIAGLTVTHQYWFDLQFDAITGGNAAITDISVYIEEF
jgi:hypothetical protein